MSAFSKPTYLIAPLWHVIRAQSQPVFDHIDACLANERLMQFVHSFLFDQTHDRIQDLLHSLEANTFTIAETVSFDKRLVVRDSFFSWNEGNRQ